MICLDPVQRKATVSPGVHARGRGARRRRPRRERRAEARELKPLAAPAAAGRAARRASPREPRPAPNIETALEALVVLVRGAESQLDRETIATAVTDDAVAWLVQHDDTALLNVLSAENDTFATRVANARGVEYYRAQVANAGDLDPRAVANGVRALLLLAQSGLPRQRDALTTVAMLAHSSPDVDAAIDAVAASLGKLDVAYDVLLSSPLELRDHVDILCGNRRKCASLGRQRSAALCVCVPNDDDDEARVIRDGGVVALVRALEIEVGRHRETEANVWPPGARLVVECTLATLFRLATREPLVCLEIKDCGGLASLVAISCTNCDAIARPSVRLLEQFFLADVETRAMVALIRGVRFLVRHLRDGVVDTRKVATLEMLTSVLLSYDDKNRAEMLERFKTEHGIEQVAWLCEPHVPVALRNKADSLLQKLPEIVPSLLARGDEMAFKTLEIMARNRSSHGLLLGSIGQHVETVFAEQRESAESVQCFAMRVLLHLASGEEVRHQLLTHTIGFINLLPRRDSSLSISVVRMLTKLARGPMGRNATAPAIPHAVHILQSSESEPALREAAARLLGELLRVRHCRNKQKLVASGGLEVLLKVLEEETALWKLHQAATTALWRLVKHYIDWRAQLERLGAVAILQAMENRNEQHPIEAVEKLLAILQ